MAKARAAPIWCNAIDALGVPGMTFNRLLEPVPTSDGGWTTLVFCNYMVDFEWMLLRAPEAISSAGRIVIVSGESDNSHVHEAARRGGISGKLQLIKAPLPISYGTHHTKMIMAFSATGVRVVVCTANFHADDWERKCQGIYVQDLPLAATPQTAVSPSPPLRDLLEYCSKGAIPPAISAMLAAHDFTGCAVRFVGSVPITYDPRIAPTHYGIKKLEQVLASLPEGLEGKQLHWQYSSQGSLTDAFLSDLQRTMLRRSTCEQILVRYPTEEEVRTSIEGWRGGSSIPVPMKNFHPFINARLHHWRGADATRLRRSFALPHIKSYVRFDVKRATADWVLITSSNLSRAAWGDSQKNNTQLMIRSYELGVLVSASLMSASASHAPFSCTPSNPIPDPKEVLGDSVGWATLTSENSESFVVALPYRVESAEPYAPLASKRDTPWAVDFPHTGKDVLGLDAATAITEHTHYGERCWSARLHVPQQLHGETQRRRIEVIDVDAEGDSDEDELPRKRMAQ